MTSNPRLRLSGLAGALLLATLLGSCAEKTPEHNPGRERAAQPIISAPVHWQHERTHVEAVGTSRARRSVMLYPDAAGEVVAVNFRAGDKVEAGEVLLRLEAEDEKLAVKLAEIAVADAERLLDRYRRTEGSGAITPSALDDAISAVNRAKIELQRARVALEDRTLKAPFAGHMGLTDIDPGARIAEDSAVASLDDRSVLMVSFAVPEILLGQLPVGADIALSTWSDSRTQAMGTVVEVDSRVDPETRTFLVRAHVDNSEDRLRPGMSFRIVLTLEGSRYPVIPEVALQWGGDGAYVWSIQDGRAKRVEATIVQRSEGKILVDADLPEGTLVVAEGVQSMREGLLVRDLSEAATAGEPAA